MASKKIPTLDLHGCTTDEIFNLLDPFIMKYKNYSELRIIVGKGKGLVKRKTIKYLKGAHYPWRYERVHGIENTGALIVDLS
jgi:DNA-nicking Smr family endonuclease